MLCVTSAGAMVYSSELLLNGIVTQKLEYERFVVCCFCAREQCFHSTQVLSFGLGGFRTFWFIQFLVQEFLLQDFNF